MRPVSSFPSCWPRSRSKSPSASTSQTGHLVASWTFSRQPPRSARPRNGSDSAAVVGPGRVDVVHAGADRLVNEPRGRLLVDARVVPAHDRQAHGAQPQRRDAEPGDLRKRTVLHRTSAPRESGHGSAERSGEEVTFRRDPVFKPWAPSRRPGSAARTRPAPRHTTRKAGSKSPSRPGSRATPRSYTAARWWISTRSRGSAPSVPRSDRVMSPATRRTRPAGADGRAPARRRQRVPLRRTCPGSGTRPPRRGGGPARAAGAPGRGSSESP